mgnify:CR=1 FL=1
MIPFKEELLRLNLPHGQYALFGSAQLAVRNLRPSKDLDIIVRPELWSELTKNYPQHVKQEPTRIHIGNIEIFHTWQNLSDKITEMIASAELIEGLPFVRIEYVLEWKKFRQQPKDIADIALIQSYHGKL